MAPAKNDPATDLSQAALQAFDDLNGLHPGFRPTHAKGVLISGQAVAFVALTDAEFVVGSAVPHNHHVVLGHHSVHTTPAALREAEAHIASIQKRLIHAGRL